MRDDFAKPVRDALAKRVRYRCSNPGCQAPTLAPGSSGPLATVSIGVASHITAAAPNGPRYDPGLSSADRKAAANGIWLCRNCGDKVDKDVAAHPVHLLHRWKAEAEQETERQLGQAPLPVTPATAEVALVVRQELALQLAHFQPPAGDHTDQYDSDLDETKRAIDGGDHAYARPLLDRLLNKNGNRLSARQRWRAESQLALCHFAADDYRRAGDMLVAAARLQPEDEMARANEASGYELLGDRAKAHELAARVRADFPGSASGLACWIRTAPDDRSPEQCLREAGERANSEAEVATSLAVRFAFRREAEFAERSARVAVRLDPGSKDGWYLLGVALHQQGSGESTAPPAVARLRESEACYTRVIDATRPGGRTNLRVSCLHNRGIVRTQLGDREAAGDDLREALRVRPDDPDLRAALARSLSLLERHDEAIAEAHRAMELAAGGGYDFLYAAALYDRNKGEDRRDAAEVFHRIVTGGGPSWDDAVECLVSALCELGRPSRAREVLASVPDDRLPPALRAAYEARVLFAEGANEQARGLARIAEAESAGLGRHHRIGIAQLLDRLELYPEAVRVLTGMAGEGVYDAVTRMLIGCALRAGDHGLVLRVCRELREAGVADAAVRRTEFELLSWYEPRQAAALVQQFLEANRDDRSARLLLSLLGQRCEEPDWVADDSEELPPAAACAPATLGRLAVGLLVRRGRPVDAIRFAYEVLRTHPDDADAHHLYLTLFFRCAPESSHFPAPEAVGPDAAVCIREVGEAAQSWVVVEPDAPVSALDECAPADPRVERMLGKKPGERFRLTAGIQERWAEVVAVMNKYLFRFERSRDGYEDRFPDRHDFQAVTVIHQQPDGSERVDLSAIYAAHDRRRESVLQLLRLYKAHPVPLHLMSEQFGRDLFETMEAFGSPGLGVRCWSGGMDDWTGATGAVREGVSLVLDATALFTLRRLDLLDRVRQLPNVSTVIAQSVFDHVRDLAARDDGLRPSGCTVPTGQNGFTVVELTDDERRRHEALRRDIVEWVRENARIEGSIELARVSPEVRTEWVSLYGRDGAESMCLATRPDHVLWTDDATVAAAVKAVFPSVRRTWTQAALDATSRLGVIDSTLYSGASARLVGWNYGVARTNADVLVQAGVLADWQSNRFPLAQAVKLFGEPSGDWAVQLDIAAVFIAKTFALVKTPFQREEIVRAVLRQFARRSAGAAVLSRLDIAFGMDAAGVVDARRYVRTWLDSPLVWVPD